MEESLLPLRGLDLPVLEIADAVKEALAVSPCLVVTAPPGAGKSTILPLILLDGQNDSQIIVLEPVLRPEREDRKPEEAGDHDGEFYTS